MKNLRLALLISSVSLLTFVVSFYFKCRESDRYKDLYETKISVHKVDSLCIVRLKEELKEMKEDRDYNWKCLSSCNDVLFRIQKKSMNDTIK